MVTSDKDSYVDSDDDYDDDFMENDVDYDDDYEDYSSRVSTTTEETSVSRQYGRKPQHTRRRYKTSYRNTDMSRVCAVQMYTLSSPIIIIINCALSFCRPHPLVPFLKCLSMSSRWTLIWT